MANRELERFVDKLAVAIDSHNESESFGVEEFGNDDMIISKTENTRTIMVVDAATGCQYRVTIEDIN